MSFLVRQLLVSIPLLIFAVGILFASIYRTTFPQYAFSYPATGDATSSATLSKEVNYYLPYPGVLPDHFLWPAKAFRDRVWLFLTTDELKRGELLLVFADKRIGAAKALFDGGKYDLALTSANKAEKYLEEAVLQEKKAREKEANTKDFLDKLALSTLKHREVLERMYQKRRRMQDRLLQKLLIIQKGFLTTLK